MLTAAAELLLTGGALLSGAAPGLRRGADASSADWPADWTLGAPDSISPRRRGVRRGLFMFLLMFVLAPLVGIISAFGLGIDPWPVGIVVFGLGGGGLLRIAYALMFESKAPPALPAGTAPYSADESSLGANPARSALGDAAASGYTEPQKGRWLETSDLEPSSVTEKTTRLLDKDN